MKKYLFPISLCFFGIIIYLILAIHQYLFAPIQTPGSKQVIKIESGQSFTQITYSLSQKGIIDYPKIFILLGKIFGKTKQIKAGNFMINSGWSRVKVLQSLLKGQEVLYKLQIPEGLTWWETAKRVQRSCLATYKSFKRAVHNQTIINKYGLQGQTAEGYLFPETYAISNSTKNNALTIVKSFIQEFQSRTRNTVWQKDFPSPNKRYQTIILASLVEKESALPRERRRIAGVFKNRLERRMRLQCDPTVIYGLGPKFDGNLQKDDLLDRSNPYNTYIHPGLPPGPICSPGLESIKAACDPEDHNYLYFVAKGDGSHKFSRTLKGHNRAVQKYQIHSSTR